MARRATNPRGLGPGGSVLVPLPFGRAPKPPPPSRNLHLSYLELVKQHSRFLAFGLTLTFLSSFGQTFFIALFNDRIRDEFGLSHSAIGTYYSLATLASGISIAWLGRKLDTVDLRTFTVVVCLTLAAAAFGMALVPGVWALIVVFYLLRLSGQGLLSHAALTSMARYFDETRGKAMSIAGLGYPLGEAVLPLLAVSLMGMFGWRGVWAGIGVLLVVVATPLTLMLLRGHGERHREHLRRLDQGDQDQSDQRQSHQPSGSSSGPAAPEAAQRQWTLKEVTRDIRFALTLPVVISPGFIITGFFFHQNHLVDTKGWSVEWFATCFAIFAAGQVVTGIASGPLVDRLSGKRLLSVFTLPMGAGLAAIALGSRPAIAALFMLSVGVTSGLAPTVVGSMWAELYGVLHLGSIRAMASSILVLGTAASPALMGWLIDGGITMEAMALAAVGYVVVASLTVTAAMALKPSPRAAA